MNTALPANFKNYSLESDRPNSLDELLNALYWYAERQVQLAKKRQETELVKQWERRVKAIDTACHILDEIDQDDAYYLIY